MAQTISAQRGNTSVAHNTATVVYTNSASGSSRVIINSFALFQNTTANSMSSALYIRNTGGGLDIPFAVFRTGVSAQACIYVPGTIPVGSVNNTGGTGFFGLTTNSNNSTQPDVVLWNWTSANVVSNGWHYCPKNIWLGPSDSIVVNQINGNTTSVQMVYNFTVITET